MKQNSVILWMEEIIHNHFLKDELQLITDLLFVEDYYTDQK